MPHQWMEGNLPVSAKCAVCDKTCGSVLRLQDWRCLWCKAMVRRLLQLDYADTGLIQNATRSSIARIAIETFRTTKSAIAACR